MPDAPPVFGRERRWLVLSTDGRHVWLGRATDPSDDEVAGAETALAAQGISGWLAVSEGDYWSGDGEMTLLMVRPLTSLPAGGWNAAVATFEETRRRAVAPSREGGTSPP